MISPFFKRPLIALLISSFSLQAHAAPDPAQFQTDGADPCASNQGQIAGAVIGALVGGFLGNKVGKGSGRKAATVAGVLGGLALGNYLGSELDRRKCEVSKIAQKNNLTVSMTDISLPAGTDETAPGVQGAGANNPVGMSVSIQDRVDNQSFVDTSGGDTLGNAALSTQFRTGSDVLSPEADGYFREIAKQYAVVFDNNALPQDASADQARAIQGLRRKRILIVGHTDDTGSSRLNADLSEQRARNVARLFAEAGVPDSQVFYQGSGETQPIADNRTENGRTRNRRVEIVDLPDEQAFQKYLANRVANTSFYRVSDMATHMDAIDRSPQSSVSTTISSGNKNNSTMTHQPRPASARAKGPSSPVITTTPTATQTVPVAKTETEYGYDFGGIPAPQKPVSIDIGRPLASKGGFSFIPSAIAADVPVNRSCTEDRPRYANAVKELQGNREYHVSEYLPNLYDTSWTDTVNGNLVALTHVAVLRDGAAPARNPTVLIYKASHGKTNQASKADFSTMAHVNTYQGEHGLLYRVFVNGPIQCMDLVLPRNQANQAANSNLYYRTGSTTMVAAFNPRTVK